MLSAFLIPKERADSNERRVIEMKRTPKVIKQQTEEWLDERWMIANMKDTRPQDMSYYMGALKALEFVGYEWKRDADGKHTLFK